MNWTEMQLIEKRPVTGPRMKESRNFFLISQTKNYPVGGQFSFLFEDFKWKQILISHEKQSATLNVILRFYSEKIIFQSQFSWRNEPAVWKLWEIRNYRWKIWSRESQEILFTQRDALGSETARGEKKNRAGFVRGKKGEQNFDIAIFINKNINRPFEISKLYENSREFPIIPKSITRGEKMILTIARNRNKNIPGGRSFLEKINKRQFNGDESNWKKRICHWYTNKVKAKNSTW